MLAHPHRGDAYRQEYSPGHAVDQAQVLGGGGAVKTPYHRFTRTSEGWRIADMTVRVLPSAD